MFVCQGPLCLDPGSIVDLVLVRLYCVDGTNAVRVFWGYAPGFEDQEESDSATLVESFGELCRRLPGSIEVEIFFDGPGRRWPRQITVPPNLRISFSWDATADELMLDRVRARSFGREGRVGVVTGDGELGRRAREEGGQWLDIHSGRSLEDVLRRIEKKFSK